MNNTTPSNQPFIMSVVSGKGGVGKTMTSVNTAEMLDSLGFRVALIDADIGLSNCSTFFNEQISFSVAHWIRGECGLEDLPHSAGNITLVTGSDNPAHHTFDPDLMIDALDQVVGFLAEEHDFIIIDTPAGAGEMTLWGLDRSHVSALVLVDEPTAISDVYRLCKYVYSIDPQYQFAGIINFANDDESAQSTHERFNNILDYFLKKKIAYLGFIPASIAIKNSVKDQCTIIKSNPGDPILDDFRYIAENVAGLAGKSVRVQAEAKPAI
jgi:flagellar biosynthesis protein FlhG